MINKEWPLSGQRQCRTNSTKLQKTDKEKKILSVMDIILTHSLVTTPFGRKGVVTRLTDTVMCRGHLECQEKVCKQVIKNIS